MPRFRFKASDRLPVGYTFSGENKATVRIRKDDGLKWEARVVPGDVVEVDEPRVVRVLRVDPQWEEVL